MDFDAQEPTTQTHRPLPDWRMIVRSPAFRPGLAAAFAVAICFWPLWRLLPALWLSKDEYYTHGFLVPLISGYVIYRWWPDLRSIPVKSSLWALPFLLALLYLTWAGDVADLGFVLSFALVGVLIAGTWVVAGRRWAARMALPAAYLLFAMPIWTFAIDLYTAPLEQLSAKLSFYMLQLVGLGPEMTSKTDIVLPHFQFEVALACSGFKLLIAVTAFTVFFMMISKLRWWCNLLMLAIVLPLCLFINALRVTLIGLVGEFGGDEAAHTFHDWSGYITLVICFFLLFRYARWLGWKD